MLARKKFLKQQKGIVLLILASVLIVSSVTIFVIASNNSVRQTQDQKRATQTRQSLQLAKQVLLAYAMENYGQKLQPLLPCPDSIESNTGNEGTDNNDEGNADHTNCGVRYENVLGRFPWKSLRVPPLFDGYNECLWYAVSGGYKNPFGGIPEMVNADTHGAFQLYEYDDENIPTLIAGNNAADRAIAVIIAPGKILEAREQTRITDTGTLQCSGEYTPNKYLEIKDDGNEYNTTTKKFFPKKDENDFIMATDDIDTFIGVTMKKFLFSKIEKEDRDKINPNDYMMSITLEDIFSLVKKRESDYKIIIEDTNKGLPKILTSCLVDYSNSNLNNNPDISVDVLNVRTPNTNPDDRRLPWPALIDLSDYRKISEYTDTDLSSSTATLIFGRFPNTLSNQSYQDYPYENYDIANPLPTLPIDNTSSPLQYAGSFDNFVEDCIDKNPDIDGEEEKYHNFWKNWKDHFFYAVADTHKPNAALPTSCVEDEVGGSSTCIRVNNKERIAAMVLFSSDVLDSQSRDSIPDSDTKKNIENYLEYQIQNRDYIGSDSSPYIAPDRHYQSTTDSNDIIWCLQKNITNNSLSVVPCSL